MTKPLFELPKLLSLDGTVLDPTSVQSQLAPADGGNGSGCDKGCVNGCANGCATGSGDAPPV